MNKIDDPKSAGQKGSARSPATSFDQMLDDDSNAVPAAVRDQSYEFLGDAPLAASRYTDQGFFDDEVKHMWSRVWQMACREEEIVKPGDFVVYENVGKSFLIVRQPDNSIRAFYNVCLHRGRKLKTESGHASRFKCPFHGFTWDLSGNLDDLPCGWDFPHLDEDNLKLPEPKVDCWGGFVFINEDPDCIPLADYLAPLPDHFHRWRLEDCFRAVYVGKVIPANWKATAEAFMEAWHSTETHPQILPYTGDSNTRYDIWGDHVNRAITPFGVLSPTLYESGKSEQDILDEFLKMNSLGGDPSIAATLPEGKTARQTIGDINRKRFTESGGVDLMDASDSEMQDAYTYNVFPNFAPWGGFTPNIIYRWRPVDNSPDKTLMEVSLLVRLPKGAPRPAPAPLHMLTDEQKFADATELGGLGDIFDQDMGNLPYVQEGLKASPNNMVHLANYQEIRIRHFHQTLDKYLAAKADQS